MYAAKELDTPNIINVEQAFNYGNYFTKVINNLF